MSKDQNRLDIVMPCYNPHAGFVAEFAHIASELRSLYPEMDVQFIIVNDGSARNFGPTERRSLLEMVPCMQIVDQIPNRGKGAAVRLGIRASKAPYTIYTDFDIPYSVETMRKVIDRVLAGDEVVIAIRDRSYYSQLSLMRKLLSHGSQFMNRLFLRIRYTDTQGGLKGLSARGKEVMLRTQIDDFLFNTEFVVLAARAKLRISEVETTLRDGVELSAMSYKVIIRELRNFTRIAFKKWASQPTRRS